MKRERGGGRGNGSGEEGGRRPPSSDYPKVHPHSTDPFFEGGTAGRANGRGRERGERTNRRSTFSFGAPRRRNVPLPQRRHCLAQRRSVQDTVCVLTSTHVCNKSPLPHHCYPPPLTSRERKTPLIRRFTFANPPPFFFGTTHPLFLNWANIFFFSTQGSFLCWQAMAVLAHVRACKHTHTHL